VCGLIKYNSGLGIFDDAFFDPRLLPVSCYSYILVLAANVMKTLLLISSFLFVQVVFGQDSKDTTILKWILDSLNFQIWQKSETINRMKWVYQLKDNTQKIDTTFIRQDSIVINRWTKENKQFYQESINLRKVSFKKEYCKGSIVKRFFDGQGRVIYIEYWDGICYAETKKEEDVRYFDSRLRQIERIIYDKAGQKIRRLTYEYQSYGREVVYEFTYAYNTGEEKQTVNKIDKYSFWD